MNRLEWHRFFRSLSPVEAAAFGAAFANKVDELKMSEDLYRQSEAALAGQFAVEDLRDFLASVESDPPEET